MSKLYFFHGKESGPFGRKYQAIKKHFPEVVSPNFQGLAIEARIKKAAQITEGKRELTLVGSSYGGLLAACLYNLYPERIQNLVLLAPALHHGIVADIQQMPKAENIRVLHGYLDEVVPFEPIAQFCQRFSIPYLAIADQHALASELAQQSMLQMIETLYQTR